MHGLIIVTYTLITLFYNIRSDSDPSFTHFIEKQCQREHNCSSKTNSHSILIAVDGTGSRYKFENTESTQTRKFYSPIGVNHNGHWIWKSHVANFWEDYQGESYYFYGPDASEMIIAGNEVTDIFNKAKYKICDFMHNNLNISDTTSDQILEMTLNGEFGIDIIGFSRGGFAAMELSRKLQFEGCYGIKPIYVRFLGLYDAVQRDIDWDDIFNDPYDNELIGNNIVALSAAERSEKIHSRYYFGYAIKGFDDDIDGFPLYISMKRFNASHSGIGGTPGQGDCCDDPKPWDIDALLCDQSYSVKLDKQTSAITDIWMRQNAINVGVPIMNEGEKYYGDFVEYFE